MAQDRQPLLIARDLHKSYRMGTETVRVLRGLELEVASGEWVCLLGSSGSGKSTLLHILGGLDHAEEGSVSFHGQDLARMGPAQRDRFRNTHVGFVFQFYHLLPELNVLENTLLSAMIGQPFWRWLVLRRSLAQRARTILEQLGLSHRVHHRPNDLSGGERQRVAIARALINQPQVLLADEPTGNLDRETGQKILDVLKGLHRAGQTIVMVSHDTEVARMADRILRLEGGKVRQ